MKLFLRRPLSSANGRNGHHPAATVPLAPGGPVAYALLQVGHLWFARICEDREDAQAVQHALEALHLRAIGAEASCFEAAHWPLHQALRIRGLPSSVRHPVPWSAPPRARFTGGGGLDATLLRTTFERAVDSEHDLTKPMYRLLFAVHPQLRALFGEDMGTQRHRLALMLGTVLNHLEDQEWLAAHLAELGARHATRYGVEPWMYGAVKEALLNVLADSIKGWEERHHQEWSTAIDAIAQGMLAGYPEAGTWTTLGHPAE